MIKIKKMEQSASSAYFGVFQKSILPNDVGNTNTHNASCCYYCCVMTIAIALSPTTTPSPSPPPLPQPLLPNHRTQKELLLKNHFQADTVKTTARRRRLESARLSITRKYVKLESTATHLAQRRNSMEHSRTVCNN